MTGLRCGKVALSGGIMLIALSLTAGTSLAQTCSCCTASPQLSFTTGTPQIGGGGCGTTKDSGGAILRRLDCGGLYFGGAGVGVPLPAVVPDLGQSILNITACSASTGALTLGATTPADSGSNRNCSAGGVSNPEYPGKNGCLFGPPLPIPNASSPATSSCVVNRVAQNATGSGNCTNGSSSVNLPLLSDIYLTGDLVSNVPGIQPCPVCLNGTCNGGPRSGLPCTPADSASLGAAYPTSHDCPPPPTLFIGSLSIPFSLSTGPQTKTSVDLPAQQFVFCGYCATQVTGTFQNPPRPCTSDANCSAASGFPTCRQRTGGAFGQAARTITETGSPAGVCLGDGAAHNATEVSVFCVPPSFNATADAAGDLPGPGAVALPGQTRFLP
ncbi:MAG: hypothetical protein E6J69_10340 [Deltaproteobacteria bacterium]|nr:MAG: hypothetical protein E6J69_10340 [Deltaproteobacteria bacterium]